MWVLCREKATIRQQLRLYSMDDSGWSSLPPNLEVPEVPRPEPDGAVSSTDSSPSLMAKAVRKKPVGKNYNGQSSTDSSEENIAKPPVTQILSEYRQPQREYKEFRSNARHHNEHFEAPRQTTVHPQVTCNMPKTRGNPLTLNLRFCNVSFCRLTKGDWQLELQEKLRPWRQK